MDTTNINAFAAPELPVAHSVAALLLMVIANSRFARQGDVTDDATKWQDAIAHANNCGWHIAVDGDGVAYADTVPAPRGFTDWWSYLRSRVNETRFFKETTRKFVLPRLAYLTRQRVAGPINAVGPIGGGTGGRGGGGGKTGCLGGGGGGGGGACVVYAATIATSASTGAGVIQGGLGGSGANASGTSSTAGGAGAGGGSGPVVVGYGQRVGPTVASGIKTQGGAAGVTAGGGFAGYAGGAGVIHVYNLLTGTGSTVAQAGGTNGSGQAGAINVANL